MSKQKTAKHKKRYEKDTPKVLKTRGGEKEKDRGEHKMAGKRSRKGRC